MGKGTGPRKDRTRVLVTGSSGNLGRLLAEKLNENPLLDVAGLDINAGEWTTYIANLEKPSSFEAHFVGVDVVVHMAGSSAPSLRWNQVMGPNIDATLNVYEAAAKSGVPRVIFASSNWVQADKRFTTDVIHGHSEPGPTNPYGISKVFGERMGAVYAARTDMSVICLRIGWVFKEANHTPGAHMAMGLWGQSMWLSRNDFVTGVEAAITAKDVGYSVINLVSNNAGMRWDIEEAERIIGFVPADKHQPLVPFFARMRSVLKERVVEPIIRKLQHATRDW